ncbi:hypothetical protein Ahy_B06g083292 [Arachis hypogaea]|uniref:Uncharacterized protein n=1 Tax=Arachis hypogaea TaxID=3818 RepID=A0A444YPK9_ARAHY|nr:hypothetical protein Ahy_B06g083292 [Arachis hypogaea]
MGGDKQDKKEKNELGKRVQGENDPDQRHLWWNYKEQTKTVSNYLQAGQQIYHSNDGVLYIVELANEEDEKEEVAKQTESIAEMWETELASHINNSLKLKRRRDDEIPMMIEGAENEEEEQRRKQWRNITATTTNVGEVQLYIGDFNDVLSQKEKVSMHPKPQAHVREFKNFVDANFLIDLDLKGSKFTWFSNPRNGWSRILEFKKHSNLRRIGQIIKSAKKLLKRDGIGGETDSEGAGVGLRIKNCKEELKKWSRSTFKRVDREIQSKKEELRYQVAKLEGLSENPSTSTDN